MQKLLLTALFGVVFQWIILGQSCLPDGVTFTTQGQIDSFAILFPDCTEIEGHLIIQTNNPITNLDGLSVLTSIGDDLIIRGNAVLSDISGLSNLTFVGRDLIIQNNPDLTSLEGLDQLTSITGSLSILANAELESLNFSSLTAIGNDLIIVSNLHITSLEGLESLNSLGKRLIIENNYSLESLTGLHSMPVYNGNVSISSNSFLKDLAVFSNTVLIKGELKIASNYALPDLGELQNLTRIEGYASSFLLNDNTALHDISGLQNLTFVGGGFFLSYNSSLDDLQGLNQLDSIGGYLQIGENDELTNLEGLNNLSFIGGVLDIRGNESLLNLSGLNHLNTIGYGIFIIGNPVLNNISILEGLSFPNGVFIQNNPHLGACAIQGICNSIFEHPEYSTIDNNASGCNTIGEVEVACGNPPLRVNVLADLNNDCQTDISSITVRNVQVRMIQGNRIATYPTQEDGSTLFGIFDTLPLALTLPQFSTANWAACNDTIWVDPNGFSGPIDIDFLLTPINFCPELSINLGLPSRFRNCQIYHPINVSIVNTGAVIAQNIGAAVVLPLSRLEIQSSDPPISAQSGDTLFFLLGNLSPFEELRVELTVSTRCDTFLMGQTICVETFASASNACSDITNSFSEIRLTSQCMGDTTVRFTLKNVGTAPTQAPHQYVIIEDEVILSSSPFTLEPEQAIFVDIPANGSTFRMEATKFDDGTLTATAIENCGGLTPGLINAYWLDQGFLSYDFDCREVVGSYDPNQKTAIPTGVGEEHLLPANRPLQYTIEFQNTGTDTAFRVLLRDILPSLLNVNTFRPGFSSYPYTWEIRGPDTLEVLFDPIALPDSNVNEPASHGFFTFDIDQQPNLPDGTVIENTASIIFDYNPPIITNTVIHTIGQLVVSINEPLNQAPLWRIAGNPMRNAATITAIDFIPGEKRFELFDTAGRSLRVQRFSDQSFVFERGALRSGIYFFRIIDARGRIATGKVVVAE